MEVMVDNAVVEFGPYLGEGSSAIVWQGKHKRRDVVVKVFRRDRAADLDAERNNLNKVKGLKGVTKYEGHAADANALLLSPIGMRFVSHGRDSTTILPSAEHFMQLVGVIKQVHDIKLLHRDLNWSNFFFAEGKVLSLRPLWCSPSAGVSE
jgi:hypothetical protein